MSTDYVQYDFKEGGRTDRYMLKIADDKIEDLLLVGHSERANPDACLEYRLDNGAIRAEYLGCGEDEFISAMLRGRGENCRVDKYKVKEATFHYQKMLANMLTCRGESTGLRFIKETRDKLLAHETRHYFNAAQLKAINVK